MSSFVNLIKINQPIETVYNWATVPSYWPKYHPVSKYVTPIVDYSPKPKERFKEGITILYINQEIEWTILKIEPPYYFEMDGYVPGFMGGTTKIKYALKSFQGATIFRREFIITRFNKIMEFMDKILIDYFVQNDGVVSLEKMKDFVELSPK